MKKIIISFTLIIFVLINSVFAQNKDPKVILSKVKSKLDKVIDYKVDVTIHVDAEFVQMPERKAVVYYKKPDKIRIKSDGFAILPKQGINFSPMKFLNSDYDAIYIKSDTLDKMKVEVVKIIPRSDTSDITLSTLWIDNVNYVVRKIEAITKNSGSFVMKFDYTDKINFGLPNNMTFIFNMGNMRIPNMNPKNIEDKKTMLKNQDVGGKVTVKYYNYIINKGVDDSVFDEKKK